jgi:spore maturation protein CgeD
MDDDSNDETQAVFDQYKNHNNITLINCGPVSDYDRTHTVRYAININKALEMSSGKYITYLTDDCMIMPNKLHDLSNYLDTHVDITTVYGIQLFMMEPGSVITGKRDIYGPINNPGCLVDHNQIMHRRSILAYTGLWNTNPAYIGMADAIFFKELAKFGPFIPVDKHTDIYRCHDKSLCSMLRASNHNQITCETIMEDV